MTIKRGGKNRKSAVFKGTGRNISGKKAQKHQFQFKIIETNPADAVGSEPG
jgi:hypothetical protein